MNTNGNELIKGKQLTKEQKGMLTLKFKGMGNKAWVCNHSFWFKNGRPSKEHGYIFPVKNK